MCQFMGVLGYSISGPSLLRMDNQSAIAVSKNPEHHRKMKHLPLHLFWLRDAVQDGQITPTFVPTQEMAANIFTRALDQFKLRKCSELIGLFIRSLEPCTDMGECYYLLLKHPLYHSCVCTMPQVSLPYLVVT